MSLGELRVGVRVIRQNLAPKTAQVLDDGATDATGAHDAHGERAQLTPLQPRQGVVVHLLTPHCGLVLAQGHEHEHDRKLGNAVRRVGGVAYVDASRLALATSMWL